MNYFENIYLGRKSESKTILTNKKLQKLLSTKALRSSADSKKLTATDFKKMEAKAIKPCTIAEIDFDNYIRPYEII